jgi:hypothetical protein
MGYSESELLARAEEYFRRKGLVCETRLGSGVHGIVLAAGSQAEGGLTAVKVLAQETFYQRERDVYLRLRDRAVSAVAGANVPRLVAYDDELWIVEMEVVCRPYVLDFAGAHLDERPDYPEEVWEEWRTEKQEQFGPLWPRVRRVLAALESHGVYMADVSPGNVALEEVV